jgi:hypothetical protein
LFLYSHRFHDHTRGNWTAGEVAGIDGDNALFCIPAQLTIPILVRWMLVLEDSDEDRLYFGKGLPREWVVSGKETKIEGAPTRWGRVNFSLIAKTLDQVAATLDLAQAGSPKEIQIKIRIPKSRSLQTAKVNGRAATISGANKDTVVVLTAGTNHFDVMAQVI